MTMKRFIRTNAFPFCCAYSPQTQSVSVETNIDDTPQVLITTLSTAPLPALLDIVSKHKSLVKCIRQLLCARVSEVISYYLHRQADDFIKLVGQLQGVFIGYTVLDFVNRKWENIETERPQCYPLEVVMDNLAVDEAITFFIDNNDNPIPITINNNPGALLKTTCVHVVQIGDEDVSKIFTEHYSDQPQLDVCQLFIRIYGTSETSVFPLPLDMNLTTFASGFTPASFFTFYPSHLLSNKTCITGYEFLRLVDKDTQHKHEMALMGKGFNLEFAHTTTNSDPHMDVLDSVEESTILQEPMYIPGV